LVLLANVQHHCRFLYLINQIIVMDLQHFKLSVVIVVVEAKQGKNVRYTISF
jgi:hypothetical protein